MIFDTHAHYDDQAFSEDREELLKQMEANGVGRVVNAGSSLESLPLILDLTRQYAFLYGAVGIHPSDTGELDEENFSLVASHLQADKMVAVGEIGLDYHWEEPDKAVQKKWFDRQLSLAKETSKPVIIHSRDAAKDTLDMVKAAGALPRQGVIHCFSYGVEMAREFLNLGYYLGIGGVVTFQNAKKMREVVEYMPMDRLLIETDAPYLAPVPFRGKRNSSLNLPSVIQAIASIKNLAPEQVEAKTWKNGCEFYGLQA